MKKVAECNPRSVLDPCWQAVALYQQGHAIAAIAVKMGVDEERVTMWLRAAWGTRVDPIDVENERMARETRK